MPIYEFRCNKCGIKFEELIKNSCGQLDYLKCPNCREQNISRLFSKFAVFQAMSYNKDVGSLRSGKCSGCTAGSCGTCGA